MSDLESILRETLARHALSIPVARDGRRLVAAVVQRRRRHIAAFSTAVLAPTIGVSAFVLRPGPDGGDPRANPWPSESSGSAEPTAPAADSTHVPRPATTDATAATTWPPSEALSMGGAASCVETYSLTTLRERAFAFDGTVTAVHDTGGSELGGLMVDVDFDVNEWFRGGTASTATVSMFDPERLISVDQSSLDAWTVGSRLLITGEPRWGGDPLDDAAAWYCGFSRTYDPDTATTWRTTLADAGESGR